MGGFLEKIQRLNSKADKFLGYQGAAPAQPDNLALNTGGKFDFRSHFMQLLNNWEFAIPNQFMFIVYISPFPAALNARDFIVYEGSDGTRKPNNIDTDVLKLTGEKYQYTDAGCMFASGLSLPQDQFTVQHAELPDNHGRGFIPGLVATKRQTFNPLILRFREHNLSFVHSIIRPWTILASHYGFIARPPGDKKNIKSTVQVIQLAKTRPDSPLINRKIYRFYDCVPYSYEAMDMQHGITDMQEINTQWVFSKYNVETLPETDVNILIEEADKSPFVSFLDKLTKGKASKFIGKADKVADTVKGAARTINRGKRALQSLGL